MNFFSFAASPGAGTLVRRFCSSFLYMISFDRWRLLSGAPSNSTTTLLGPAYLAPLKARALSTCACMCKQGRAACNMCTGVCVHKLISLFDELVQGCDLIPFFFFFLQSCWTVCGRCHLCPPPAPRPPRAATPKGRTRRAARGRPAKMSARDFCASTSGTSQTDRYYICRLPAWPFGTLFVFAPGSPLCKCQWNARAHNDGNSLRHCKDLWYFWARL